MSILALFILEVFFYVETKYEKQTRNVTYVSGFWMSRFCRSHEHKYERLTNLFMY